MSVITEGQRALFTDAIETSTQHYRITGPARSAKRATTQPTVSVIIPTLNEEKNLPHVLDRLPEAITELIIVDGHSIDDTIGWHNRCVRTRESSSRTA
jgi:cellulose synthase/poly-beta-1,6-N-acetylglucosamine synthase-like glycosyltransferase